MGGGWHFRVLHVVMLLGCTVETWHYCVSDVAVQLRFVKNATVAMLSTSLHILVYMLFLIRDSFTLQTWPFHCILSGARLS